jgi:hypothetical protein
VTEFVGAGREQFVDDLISSFNEVVAGQGPRMVALSAASGVGKTRIVQEFYRRLAAAQQAPCYWPTTLTDDVDWKTGRKLLAVAKFQPEAKAEMPWLYWSVSCWRRPDGNLHEALFSGVNQFEVHADYLLHRLGTREATERGIDNTSAVLGMLGILGVAFPPLAIGISIASVTGAALKDHDLVERHLLKKKYREKSRDGTRVIDAATHGYRRRSEELVADVVKVSMRVPIIIAVDDAHWADEFTIFFLDQLLRRERARVLIVVTAWPEDSGESGGEEGLSPFATWVLNVQSESEGRRVEIREVEMLDSSDLTELVRALYSGLVSEGDPRLDDKVAAQLVAQLQSPLAIRAFFDLKKVKKQIHVGGLELQNLTDLPADLTQIMNAYWQELPEPVRSVLAIAATYGEHFARAPVIAAAERLDQPDPMRQLTRSRDPYGMIRDLNESLEEFTDFLHHRPAIAQSHEDFTDGELSVIYDAIATYAAALNQSGETGPLATTVWATVVALAQNDVRGLVDREQASTSAWLLADASASVSAYADAIHYGNLSLEWSALPAGNRELLRKLRILANWNGELGRMGEAIAGTKDVLQRQLLSLEPGDLDVLETQNQLAHWNGESGDALAAANLYRSLLDELKSEHETGDEEELTTRGHLAHWIGECGDVTGALEAYRSLLDDQTRLLGGDDVETLWTRNHLAHWIGESGDVTGALEAYRSLLDDQTRLLGGNRLETLRTRNNLAHWIGESGDTDAAVAACEGLLADEMRILGPDQPDTLRTRNHLAHWIRTSGDAKAASEQFESLLNDQIRVLGANHPDTVNTKRAIAKN